MNQEKNEASVSVFYADWTSVPVPQTSSLRGLDVGFIPPLPKKLPYMANNDQYNDEYLCDFFVGFIFWPKLSFQIQNFEFTGTNSRRDPNPSLNRKPIPQGGIVKWPSRQGPKLLSKPLRTADGFIDTGLMAREGLERPWVE